MNIFKEYYLRWFKGYTFMNAHNAKIIELFFKFGSSSGKVVDILPVRGGYIVSKPYYPVK